MARPLVWGRVFYLFVFFICLSYISQTRRRRAHTGEKKMLKTYQIFQTISREFFIEAESEDQAFEILDLGQIKPTDETAISAEIADIHDGQDWQVEKTGANHA
jgi:hypothetical protein